MGLKLETLIIVSVQLNLRNLKNIDCLQLPQSFALEMRHQM